MEILWKAITDPSALGTIIGAAISALIVMVLWGLNQIAERNKADRLRNERKEDVMQALIAEVRAFTNSRFVTEKDVQNKIEKLDEIFVDDEFVPFVPIEKNDIVYETVLSEIQILPRPVIGPVVNFYNQTKTMNLLQEDLQKRSFAELSADRKKALLNDYLNIQLLAYRLARKAIDELERQSKQN